MWGRDKNFQVSMLYELRNCENNISLSEVFFTHPLFNISEQYLSDLYTTLPQKSFKYFPNSFLKWSLMSDGSQLVDK